MFYAYFYPSIGFLTF